MLFDTNPIPPIDYIFVANESRVLDEKVICAWSMQLVHDLSENILQIDKEKGLRESSNREIEMTDAVINFYEDQYYKAIQSLYNCYCFKKILEKLMAQEYHIFIWYKSKYNRVITFIV